MIRDNSLHAILTLSDGYAKNNVVLRPLEGSVLFPLCRLSNPLNGEVEGHSVSPYDIPEMSRNRRADGVSGHDEEMEEAVSAVAQIVRSNLQLAQTTVNPVIKRVVENTEQTLQNSRRSLEQPITVVQSHYHKIWNNPILESFVERYDESPAFEVRAISGMPALTADQLEECLGQDISRFDEDLKDLVVEQPSSWLVGIYESVFRPYAVRNDEVVELSTPAIDGMLSRPVNNRDELIVVFCLARRFLDNVPEGAEFDLTAFRDWMVTLQSQAGRAILKVYEARERAKRNRQLVLQYPGLDLDYYKESGSYVLVNSEVYATFLEEGGSPEVLLGAAVTDKQEVYSVLIENADQYVKAWKRQERILGSELRFDRFNQTVSALESSIALEINGLAELGVFGDDLEELDSLRQDKHGKLKQAVRELTARQTDTAELYRTARSLVCSILFPRTEAEKILCAIDAAAEQNPDIDIREAAFLAVIEVVAEWVGCQIDVEHH